MRKRTWNVQKIFNASFASSASFACSASASEFYCKYTNNGSIQCNSPTTPSTPCHPTLSKQSICLLQQNWTQCRYKGCAQVFFTSTIRQTHTNHSLYAQTFRTRAHDQLINFIFSNAYNVIYGDLLFLLVGLGEWCINPIHNE